MVKFRLFIWMCLCFSPLILHNADEESHDDQVSSHNCECHLFAADCFTITFKVKKKPTTPSNLSSVWYEHWVALAFKQYPKLLHLVIKFTAWRYQTRKRWEVACLLPFTFRIKACHQIRFLCNVTTVRLVKVKEVSRVVCVHQTLNVWTCRYCIRD